MNTFKLVPRVPKVSGGVVPPAVKPSTQMAQKQSLKSGPDVILVDPIGIIPDQSVSSCSLSRNTKGTQVSESPNLYILGWEYPYKQCGERRGKLLLGLHDSSVLAPVLEAQCILS